ncbi:MAG: M3 family oligoendopeptidase, partial [Flavisolibacter sp.]
MEYTAQITSIPRNFLPKNFKITDWETLEPFLKELLERPINSVKELEKWLQDISELEAVIGEDAAWRQIKMTCDTENKELEEAFTYFVMEIQPRIQPYSDKLNHKLLNNEYTRQLDQQKYFVYLRNVKKNIELFRDQNIPLQADIAVLAQQYGVITGKMTVEIEGREYTLQQAAKFLENPSRHLREEVYFKIQDRRLEDKDQLNDLFSKLLEKRDLIAHNAGFSNYRDYKFADLGR